MIYKRQRICSVQRKLANLGVERTPVDIWEDVMESCGQDPDLAMMYLFELDQDGAAFVRFANGIAGAPVAVESVKYVPYEVKEYVKVFVGQELVFFAAVIGVLIGVLISSFCV
jgi:hypothetical protein